MKTFIAAVMITLTASAASADDFTIYKNFFGKTYEYVGATDRDAVLEYLDDAKAANEASFQHIKGEGEASVYYKPETGRVVVKTSKQRFDVRELAIIREYTSRDLYIGELFVLNSHGVLKDYRKVYVNPMMSRGGVRWKALRAENDQIVLPAS